MKHFILLISLISISLIACNSNVDEEYPEISLNVENAFPLNCDTIYAGQDFHFRALFTDNVELGSYSIEIHNNFDHHTHSTEAEACDFDEDKVASNAWLYLESFNIPDATSEYTADDIITVPQDIESGDYHFQIRLTDHEGWQTLKGLSVKIL